MIAINPYKVYSLLTSHFALDGGAMFGIIPRPLWKRKISADAKNRIDMVTRSLLIVGEGKKILVDTGNGDNWDEKSKKIYKIDTETVNIDKSLQELGMKAEDITDVILTHLHFDHTGGSTKMKDGKLVPTFPNASYYVQKKNYEHACSPTERDRGSYLKHTWEAIEERGQLEIVDGAKELFPGIQLLVRNGHTVGQQLPLISDGETTLFFCGDLVPTMAHIPLPWIMSYDLFPLTTLEEKKRTFPQAVAENWILFFEHDAKHVASRVVATSKGFAAGDEVEI